jgi:hypothetical protein
MKNINLTPAIIVAAIFSLVIFSNSDANAQSSVKKEKVSYSKQSVAAINSEILGLERELASLEVFAKQNNVDLGKPYEYMILNKTAFVAVVEEKATAKN